MREMEVPVAGGCPDGNSGGRSRRTRVEVRQLCGGAGGAARAAGTAGRTAAPRGARGGSAGGISCAGVGRSGGGERSEARAAVASMGAGRSDGGDRGDANDWFDVAPESSTDCAGDRTGRRPKARRMASTKRRTAGSSRARDFADNAETRRVVPARSREDG